MNHPRPLQSRITRTLFVVACLVFIGAAGVIGWLHFNEEKEHVAKIMQAQVEIVQSLIRGQILHDDSRLHKLSTDLAGKDDQAVLDGIRGRLPHYDPFDIYYVLDNAGRIVLISDEFRTYLGFNPTHMGHLRRGQE
ncbi:hypothetical protein ACFL5J_02185, partial [Thermodesulfobacteriota bacterium]